MLKISKESKKIFIVELKEPRETKDEVEFIDFLNNLFEYERFGLVLSVEGKKFFSLAAKKEFNLWFKTNKQKLSHQCIGFARINKNMTKMNKIKSKAMTLAMPCCYEVFKEKEQGLNWIQSLIHE